MTPDQPELWQCPECADEMPAKYERIHPLSCALASVLEGATVDELLTDVLGESP